MMGHSPFFSSRNYLTMEDKLVHDMPILLVLVVKWKLSLDYHFASFNSVFTIIDTAE